MQHLAAGKQCAGAMPAMSHLSQDAASCSQEEVLLSLAVAMAISWLLFSLRPSSANDYAFACFFLICTTSLLKIRCVPPYTLPAKHGASFTVHLSIILLPLCPQAMHCFSSVPAPQDVAPTLAACVVWGAALSRTPSAIYMKTPITQSLSSHHRDVLLRSGGCRGLWRCCHRWRWCMGPPCGGPPCSRCCLLTRTSTSPSPGPLEPSCPMWQTPTAGDALSVTPLHAEAVRRLLITAPCSVSSVWAAQMSTWGRREVAGASQPGHCKIGAVPESF